MISVLIVDDHKLVVEGISLMLSDLEDIKIIGTASNGIEALELIQLKKPDIVLLDLNMPKMNGLELCKKLHPMQLDTKIIILSMMDEIKLIQRLIQKGADGYLLKNSGKDEVVGAIRKVHNGEKHFDQSVLIQLMTNAPKTRSSHSLMPKISKRENEILRLIMDELTSNEIASKLFISLGTVETHRRNLINKLGVRNTAGLVKKSIEMGLV